MRKSTQLFFNNSLSAKNVKQTQGLS